MTPVGMKNGPRLQRDWTLAIAEKIEDQPCRVCRTTSRPINAAHIAGREHDSDPAIGFEEVPSTRSKLFVAPTRVLPLCGPPTDPESCHGKQHCGEGLDLLPHLQTDEAVQAVADLGSIATAYRVLSGRVPTDLELSRMEEQVR